MTDKQYRLTTEEREMLNKYLDFYLSLDRGIRNPKTAAQRHFVLVCRGKDRQQTAHEFVYMKYRRMEEARQSSYQRHKVKTKKRSLSKSGTNKKIVSISAESQKSERENISRIISRRKKISNAMVIDSD